MRVSLVPTDHVDLVWGEVVKHLMRPVNRSYGRYTIVDVYAALHSGTQQLWVVYEGDDIIAAITTGISIYPNKKCLTCMFCGGRGLDEWAEEADYALSQFARDEGCESIELTGRIGWKKVLEKFDWDHRFVGYEKELTNGEE